MSFSEVLFKLNVGVDTYNPDHADGLDLKFLRLKNIQPERNRFQTPRGLMLLQQIFAELDAIRSFAFYNIPTSQITNLYAISNTRVYEFDFAAQLFNIVAIYSSFNNTPDPYAKTSWLDATYVTKRFAPLVKLQGSTATEIAGAPGGRYMIIADSHLMIANTTSGGLEFPVRVQWSDLYAPESWAVGPASEADFFELSPDDGEVTGLSYQRGATLIYTRDRVWVGRYVKGNETTLGKYQFDTLFSGIGNIYHDAQIRVKEVDYFIGLDNFYKIDGFQLTEIGDPIWQYFQDTIVNANFQDSVIAIHVPDRYSVAWVYDHVDGGRWSVVYNYKENKWSDRDPEDVFCVNNFTFPVQGYLAYEDVDVAYEDMDTEYPPAPATYDGPWQLLGAGVRNLFGSYEGRILVPSSPAAYVKFNDAPFDCEFETFEFDFDELDEVKEISRLKVTYSLRNALLDPLDNNLELLIGSRNKRDDDVVWSPPILMIEQLADESVFHFRRDGIGKLVRFKLRWSNTLDFAITEFTKMSIYKLEQEDATESPEK